MENEASCAKMYLSLPQREVPPPPPHDLSLLSSVRERDLYVEARPRKCFWKFQHVLLVIHTIFLI